MSAIEKLKLFNFKRFYELEVPFESDLNILIGDNESGKSSLLLAIDLVLSGNVKKVESIHIENLFNRESIESFLSGDRLPENLPVMSVELFLNEQDKPELNGKVNSDGKPCDGVKLVCEPNPDYSRAIDEVLSQGGLNFPYEYYSIKFTTFSGEGFSGYRNFFNHLLLDSHRISSDYAIRDYVRKIYRANSDDSERTKHQNEYRRQRADFQNNVLTDINSRLIKYQFAVRTGADANLESDLTVAEDKIPIEQKGRGRQSFIKTDFALAKKASGEDLDFLLIEEPENHLSHVNVRHLVNDIASAKGKQLFVATHDNLISARLGLRNAILLNSSNSAPALLRDLPEDTARFFMKAPDHNILEYVLASRVILVEGDAEYILAEEFFKQLFGTSLESQDVYVIAIGGTSFKRYLDLGNILNIKTAVITDNDGDYVKNCEEKYRDYESDNVGIFYEKNNDLWTFERCLYKENVDLCDKVFSEGRRSLTVEEYMLKNKADAAFYLLEASDGNISVPAYIQRAMEWIRE